MIVLRSNHFGLVVSLEAASPPGPQGRHGAAVGAVAATDEAHIVVDLEEKKIYR